jgi:hypothetical protein
LNDGGTQEDKESALLVMRVQAVRKLSRQIHSTLIPGGYGEGNLVPKFLISHCQEKPLVRK